MLKKLQDKALAVSVLVLASVPAMAQTVTDPFDAAMTEATTKVGSYAAAQVWCALQCRCLAAWPLLPLCHRGWADAVERGMPHSSGQVGLVPNHASARSRRRQRCRQRRPRSRLQRTGWSGSIGLLDGVTCPPGS